jgi:SH3-like domain-containing protein
VVLVVSDPIADIAASLLKSDRPPLELAPAIDRPAALFVLPSVVNMRKEPSQESPVIGNIKQAVAVIEVARQGAWIQVVVPENGGQQGWIDSSLLGAEPPVQPLP